MDRTEANFMRRVGLFLFLFAFFVSGAWAEEQPAPAELSMFVFDDELPLSDVTIHVDGRPQAVTNDNGAAWLLIGSGDHTLTLEKPGRKPTDIRLQVDRGENVRVITTLKPGGGEPVVDIQSSGGRDSFLAEGRAGGPAQGPSGVLEGRALSSEDGEPVAGARVFVSGTPVDVQTDEQGRFRAELPVGTYSLSVIHGDYSTQTKDGIKVAADKTAETDVELTPAGLEMKDFVVTVPYIEGSVASAISGQREASGVSEVLGAEQMSRSGDSDAADALARVTGLTIEDGKYVVVRGQPARYTATLLNGSPLPSPDPINRIVPLDLFPTGILSGIQVEKSYLAERPGAFGSGLVDLETAGVPEEGFLKLSAGTGMNTISTGRDGLDHAAGGTDFLATDDGSRGVPPGVSDSDDLEEAAKGFANNWAAEETTLSPDQSLGISGGTRMQALGGELGFRAALDWGRSASRREITERDYAVAGDGSLDLRNDQETERTDVDFDLGGSFIAAMEWDDHALRSNTFLLRKATRRTEKTEGVRAVSNDYYIRDTLLEWTERGLLAQQFLGEHDLGWLEVDWRTMLARSSWDQPDRRDYRYRQRQNGDGFIFERQNGARRHFSESQDDIFGLDVDLTLPVLAGDRPHLDLKGGVSFYDQQRQSRVERYRFEPGPGADLEADPEVLLDPANLGDTLEVRDDTQDNDNYDGTATVQGSYLGFDFEWGEALRVNGGLRHEMADFAVQTFRAGGSAGPQEVGGAFNESSLLPALGMTWRFMDTMQLRAAAGRSTSRPMLNELSPGRYYDPDTGEEFLGNPDLRPAEIDSVDLRWEWFPTSRELLSLGAFQKEYTDPLEESFVAVGGSSYLRRVQNAAGASVRGVELSAITYLDRVGALFGGGGWTENVFLQGNAAFIDSEVELASQDLATSADRPLQGQADTVYNLQLGYDGTRHDATLALNRVGERLMIAGVQGQPDVYQRPTTQLNLTYSYSPLEDLKVKLSAKNLLDTEYTLLQGDKVYRSYTKGTDIGLSVSYRFD